MKRMLLCLYVIVLLLISKNNTAQPVTLIKKNQNSVAYTYIDSKNSFTSNVPLNEINARAYRHFEKNYSSIAKETWTKIANGVVVTFTSNSAYCKIFYNTNGDFIYSYKYYNDKNCGAEFSKMIQNIYPQYKIVSVIELFDGNKFVYGINISNEKVTKSLEVKNGEVRVLNEF